MKANFSWNYDTRSIDSQFVCGLGVNNKTGRLQWFPGCACCKILTILIVIMTPIILLTLLIKFGGGKTIPFLDNDEGAYVELISEENSPSRDPRCTAVRLSFSEVADNEERELLKDIRTSFIPPEFVIIPPDCINPENDINLIENAEFVDDLFDLFDISSRNRRSFENNSTLYAENIPLDDKKESQNSYQEQSEYDESMEINLEKIAFNSFWKGEGNKQSIRLIQAKVMLRHMDQTVDPCTDFYQYACGNWDKFNPIPKDKAGYDTFEMLRENLDLVLKELLEDKINYEKVDRRPLNIKKVLTTNEDKINEKSDLRNADILKSVRLRKHIIKKRKLLGEILDEYQTYLRQKRKNQLHYLKVYESNDAERKAKDLYASCMNYGILKKRGNKPLLTLLESFGGWPVLDENWSDENFDWLFLIAKMRTYNNDILLVQWVGPDIKNSEENVIQFDQTSLGLPTRDYFLHDSNVVYLEAYKNFMSTVMHLLGADKKTALKAADDVIKFETELAKIITPSEERVNVSLLYKQMSIEELSIQVPEIKWQQYLEIVQNRSVNVNETVVIYAIEYMHKLVILLNSSSNYTLANYILWRFVRHRINNLDDRFQSAKQNFFHSLFGREKSPPRWKNCVGQVNSNMGMALGAMFVRKYFNEVSKMDTMEMTNDIQEAFRSTLNKTYWLDSTTRKLAEEKVNSMSLKIGYPDFILDSDELNKRYEGLEINPEKYFENTLNVLRHVSKTEQIKITEIVNKTVWQTAPAIVNAYYSRNKNQIMFPAGILQPPFYHRFFPRSLNFGGIGVVIGHELTHGFDDKGRLFDSDGNIHKWWSDSSINRFHERSNCLISQYGNYTVSEVGIAIDGETTQGENIADNGGIRQAFHAYRNWLNRNTESNIIDNEILPGLNLTNTQLFFLNFAQVWCGTMRPEATRNKLKTAVHSPGKFRVIGTLSNSEDFSHEFKCPVGSPMNPPEKCSVW